jgi:type IV pilus assembly protein PilY1
MRIAHVLVATWSGVALTLVAAGDARAQGQTDVNPPLPDVLLMVDNSGSMERMIDGTLPENTPANACDVSNCIVTGGAPPTTTCTVAMRSSPLTTFPPPNRWNNVLQALTGSPVNGYHCIAMPRTSGSTFNNEYEINGAAPYDTGYYLPYHRAVAMDPAIAVGATTTTGSKACVFAPGSLPGEGISGVGNPASHAGGNASDFPGGAIINRPYGQLTVSTGGGCNFAQNTDGLIANYEDLIRFGLMTFDQDPSPAIGVTTLANPQILPGVGQAFTGMWSYFPGWDGSSTSIPATGDPVGCFTPQQFEVGARNPAAPPWEGRMMYFPSDETQTTRDSQNAQIQLVLNATRPYGGTPLAGMFADAQYYFGNDPKGPNGAAPAGDPLVQGGCRKQFIVLLTDGAPNEDMRPTYEGGGVYAGGCGTQDNPSAPCPYNHPEFTAGQLANPVPGQNPVYTYVIGFAVSSALNDSGTLVNCESINVATDCANLTASSALIPCCELQKIAVAGAPPTLAGQPQPHAYFADNPGDLQAALGAIFSQIAQTTTTRTTPAYSSVTNVSFTAANPNAPNQETFYGFFNPAPSIPPPSAGLASVGQPWSGDVTRSRFNCGGATPGVQAFSKASGDDFGSNLNTNSPARYFIAVEANSGGTVGDSSTTLRPFYALSSGGDGLGNLPVKQFPGTASSVIGNVLPPALGLPAAAVNACQYTSNQGLGQKFLTSAQCSNMLLDFTFGQAFSGPSDFTFISRVGNAFGGVYHASPVEVGPPSALLHDDSYNAFSTATNVVPCTSVQAPTGTACRQNILYSATTDGLLHAFWSDTLANSNNEQWAMIPPAVLPNLLSSYPAEDKFLLDGSPVVKDVVFDRAQGAPGNAASWHTMLVAAYGPQQLGYYAIDITTPTVPVVAATTPGPIFNWQLTKMPATNEPLFGNHGATPAITTVFIGSPGPAHEVGVAILPGGMGLPAQPPTVAGGCARATVSGGDVSQAGSYAYRSKVQCWGATGAAADPVPGRSVTVVRLDTGEVVATFMRKVDAPAGDTLRTAGRIVDTPFDSPMTGTPVVYPSDVGSIASKAFIADQDGTIWKLDLSNPDPTQWTGKLFFDLYNQTVETAASAWSDGQPVALPIQLSLDRTGSLVLNVASGSQDTFTQTGLYFVYSIGETVQTVAGVSSLRSLVNWYLASSTSPQLTAKAGVMGPGERVSGPMVVFDSTLYFSTYLAPSSASLSCTAGDAHLWGRDFEKPYVPSDLSQGGLFVQPAAPTPLVYVDLVTNGAVVPGVSVQATTACVGLGTAAADQYVPGASHSSITSFTGGSFSLVAQVGATAGKSGGTIAPIALPTPREPTMISSWAGVVE